MDPDKIFDNMDDTAKVQVFDNERFLGLHIRWSLHKVGFGELVLTYDRESKKWTSDTECMATETVEKILKIAAPELAKLYIELDI